MTRRLDIPKQAVPGLEALRDLDAAAIDTAATRLPPMRLATVLDLADVFEDVTGADKATHIATLLLSLVRLSRDRFEAPAELLEALDPAVRALEWTDEQMARWTALRPTLVQLLSFDSLVLLEKRLHVTYDHENVLQRLRIVTEVRPLFGAGTERILDVVVTQMLRLEYDRDDGAQSMSIALDEEDLDLLLKECARAKQKHETVRAFVTAAFADCADATPANAVTTSNGQ